MLMRKRVPNVALTTMTKKESLFSLGVGNFLPTVSTMHYTLYPILLCPLCFNVADPIRKPYEVCNNCGVEVIFYRGPVYVNLQVSKSTFVPEMVRDSMLDYEVVPSDPSVKPIIVSVPLQASWSAMSRGYRDGTYTGFAIMKPRVFKTTAEKLPVVTLLNPVQAAFYERYTITRREVESGLLKHKKYDAPWFQLTKTFLDLYDMGVFDVSKRDKELFLKCVTMTRNEFTRSLNEILLQSITG